MQLTAGFSPQEIPKAARLSAYGGAFIDGLHTNEQMVADFAGILPRLSQNSVVVFHDVAICNLDPAWAECQALGKKNGFVAFELPWTLTGCTVLVRGLEPVAQYFAAVGSKLRTNEWRHYRIGMPHSDRIHRIFHRTLYELWLNLCRRLKRLS